MTSRKIDPPSMRKAFIMSGDINDDDEDDAYQKKIYIDILLDWVVFPLLLFVQFGSIMYSQQQQGILRIQWVPTMAMIAVFCIACIVYRKLFRVHPLGSMVLLLVPEFATNAVLATVMLTSDLTTALYTLVGCTVVLSVTAAIGQLQVFLYNRSIRSPEPDDYRILNQDEQDDVCDDYNEHLC